MMIGVRWKASIFVRSWLKRTSLQPQPGQRTACENARARVNSRSRRKLTEATSALAPAKTRPEMSATEAPEKKQQLRRPELLHRRAKRKEVAPKPEERHAVFSFHRGRKGAGYGIARGVPRGARLPPLPAVEAEADAAPVGMGAKAGAGGRNPVAGEAATVDAALASAER